MPPDAQLPVASCLDSIISRLEERGTLIVSAAPGAGKTSLVPGALAASLPEDKQVILLEPRRVAATAAASRISTVNNSSVGEFAGYIVRGERKISDQSRVAVMTPGVLLRKLQQEPALEGAGAVIFDEFHERSLECDLLLALILELRKVFREDLKLLIMSATLESSRLSEMLSGAEVIDVPGREFPVEIRWSSKNCELFNIAESTAAGVMQMLNESSGNMLAFLPGVGEIRKCRDILENRLPENIILQELHGSLPLKEQNSVLGKAPPGCRKVVLATNVAESSLTVDNVTCVVDSGFARVPRYDISSGLSFLETSFISRASAEQRSGRAGRVAPGVALRLWRSDAHAGRPPFAKPEILESELSRLALEIILWGAGKDELEWLDKPPEAAYNDGVNLLIALGAVDKEKKLLPLGRKLAELPVHPRIGALLLAGKEQGLLPLAIEIAAILENRDCFDMINSADLGSRVEYLRAHLNSFRNHKTVIDQLRSQMGCRDAGGSVAGCGSLLLTAFPERLAGCRKNGGGSYTLKNGRGGHLKDGDWLLQYDFLAVASLSGSSGGDSVINVAAPVDKDDVLRKYKDDIRQVRSCKFDFDSGRAAARQEEWLGRILLSSRPAAPEKSELTRAVLESIAGKNKPIVPDCDKKGRALLERLRFARRNDSDIFPEISEVFLLDKAPVFLPEIKNLNGVNNVDWSSILRNIAGMEVMKELERLYPAYFVTPAGGKHLIDYSGEFPRLSVKLQEMLGVGVHPLIGSRKKPLQIELLSPALRPIQITMDLPGFWVGSYALVRKEMRSRYPKHDWPEDPLSSTATLRSVKKKQR